MESVRYPTEVAPQFLWNCIPLIPKHFNKHICVSWLTCNVLENHYPEEHKLQNSGDQTNCSRICYKTALPNVEDKSCFPGYRRCNVHSSHPAGHNSRYNWDHSSLCRSTTPSQASWWRICSLASSFFLRDPNTTPEWQTTVLWTGSQRNHCW